MPNPSAKINFIYNFYFNHRHVHSSHPYRPIVLIASSLCECSFNAFLHFTRCLHAFRAAKGFKLQERHTVDVLLGAYVLDFFHFYKIGHQATTSHNVQ